MVILFFVRAFRICSEEFFDAECIHVKETFSRLGYPTGTLNKLQKEAECIYRTYNTATTREGKEKEYIVVPCSKKAERITRLLTRIGMNIVNSSGKR